MAHCVDSHFHYNIVKIYVIVYLFLEYNVHVKQDKEFINLNEPDIIKDRNCRERRFIEYGKEKSVFTRI